MPDKLDMETRLNELVKEAKSPAYPLIILATLFLLFFGIMLLGRQYAERERQNAMLYIENPKDNVLLLTESEEGTKHLYTLIFIPEAHGDSFLVLAPKHAYSSFLAASDAFRKLISNVSRDSFRDEFYGFQVMRKEELANSSPIKVEYLKVDFPLDDLFEGED